ncbi:unnamed protein product, partial [Ectocarpus sp. 12 AP-2014]
PTAVLWHYHRCARHPLPSCVDIYTPGPTYAALHICRESRGGPSCQRVIMLIARAMLAKIRPPPLNPREIQNQVDISRAAGLTAVYAAQQQQDEESSCSFDQLEKEVAALKPLERKRRAQTAINDQVVTYFTLVHAAHTATPPPTVDINGGNSVAPGKDQDSPSSKGSATDTPSALRGTSLSGVKEEKAEKAAEGKAVKRWRRKLLKEMLRSELGFNTVVKDSTLSGAGLGLFVEGSAPEGAVVAIYPGLVHLPEHLRNQKYAASLLPDEDHFLMGRADGCLVDGRTAGLLPSSPLTFAHAANHPPEGQAANVLQVAYDFPALSEDDVGIAKGGRFPERLRPLVPNRYHRAPKALFGGKLDQSAMVETVVLVACRGGLHDQEVFMDYRFNPNMPHPDWYSPVDPEATAKMWAVDKQDSTAQTLLDNSWY